MNGASWPDWCGSGTPSSSQSPEIEDEWQGRSRVGAALPAFARFGVCAGREFDM